MAQNEIQLDTDMKLSHVLTDCEEVAIEAATVEATLTDKDTGVEIAGQVWPLALVEGATPGTYEGMISDAIVVTLGQRVEITIVSDDGAGLDLTNKFTAIIVWG